MNNPCRISAEVHKLNDPSDPRSLDELESYYRNLAHASPLARAFSEIAAEERATEAQEFAELCAKATMKRVEAGADEMAEMLREGNRLAEIWEHLGHDGMIEQIEAHLESDYENASDEVINAVIQAVLVRFYAERHVAARR